MNDRATDTDVRDTDVRDTDVRDTDVRDTDVRHTDVRHTDVRRARRTVSLLLLALGLGAASAFAALPPGYGGELRLPSPSPLSTPSALGDGSPFSPTVAAAVFDGLYGLTDDGRVIPSLAEGPPVLRDDGSLLVTIRENVRRHDRRTLRALDVARALRQASRTQPHWLAGFSFEGNELDVRPEGERGLRFVATRAFASPTDALMRRLAAAPLAVDLGRGVGTGPYRAVVRGGTLELRSFRTAARGAAFVDVIRFDPPRARDEEIRAFELRQLDASWQGAALYGRPDPNVREHGFSASTVVLLVPSRALVPSGATLDRALDRRRFARVGLRPSDRLAEGLPSPSLTGTRALPTTLRLVVRADDAFEAALAAALAARFDELGVRLTIAPTSADRFERERTSADLSIAYVVPAMPGSDALVAAASFATTHDANVAARALDATPEIVSREAAALPALVLGHLARTLHHREPLRGVAHDALGRLRLERLHLPRSATTEDE